MEKKQEQSLIRISERIKQLRIEKGYTSYRNFADDHGLEPKQYWKLEEGKVDFRISSLLRILKIHELTTEEFFREV